MQEIRRGDIYYIDKQCSYGSEQFSGRPAIVVSNELCNKHSDVIEVVYLTTQPKNNMPTHIHIKSAPRDSIALCEQITSVFIDRIGDYVGTCTEIEMEEIDAALRVSLGLTAEKENSQTVVVNNLGDTEGRNKDEASELDKMKNDLLRVTAERDLLETLYNKIISTFASVR